MRIVRRNRRGLGLEGFRAHTHNTIGQLLCEKERCMVESNSTPSYKMNECTRGRLTHTRHEYSNAFVKRRGTWARAKQPLVTRGTNAREEGLHTHKRQLLERLCEYMHMRIHIRACMHIYFCLLCKGIKNELSK